MEELSSRISSSSGEASPASTMARRRPSTSRTMRPYEPGSSASKERTVTAAPSRRCAARSSSSTVVVSRGASPARTSTSPSNPSREAWAAAAASPVPRGSSWTATTTPSGRVSASSARVSGEVTTTSGSGSNPRTATTTQSTSRRPRSGWRCLGRRDRMRVPSPAARTTAARGVRVTRWESWLGREDSNLRSRDQNPLPYRLATPQRHGQRSPSSLAPIDEQHHQQDEREDDEHGDRQELDQLPEQRDEKCDELRDGCRPGDLADQVVRGLASHQEVKTDRDERGSEHPEPAQTARQDEDGLQERDEEREAQAHLVQPAAGSALTRLHDRQCGHGREVTRRVRRPTSGPRREGFSPSPARAPAGERVRRRTGRRRRGRRGRRPRPGAPERTARRPPPPRSRSPERRRSPAAAGRRRAPRAAPSYALRIPPGPRARRGARTSPRSSPSGLCAEGRREPSSPEGARAA